MVNSREIRLLTPREVQVVALVADGLSNREVVRELRLSKHAIQNISSGFWIGWGSKAAWS
jgi:DNA-binding NarL/FixJ family response regulator